MKWTLFDYGVGNIHSLRKAMEAQGESVQVTQDPRDLHDADAIILPGVGAFGAVMRSLEPARQVLLDHHEAGKPLLGICIGMQALYEGSEEDQGTQGLGILPGRVAAIPSSAGKVPHMGWNTVQVRQDGALPTAMAAHYVYYVHSYAAPPGPDDLGTTRYGVEFAAGVHVGNTIAFQFHPEKSSGAGQDILAAAIDAMRSP